jgi:hypothetical protein
MPSNVTRPATGWCNVPKEDEGVLHVFVELNCEVASSISNPVWQVKMLY